MRSVLYLFALIILTACKTENQAGEEKILQEVNRTQPSDKSDVDSYSNDNGPSINHQDPTESNQKSASNYSYKVIYDEKTGWGYQIFNGSQMVINQIHIPAVQGIQGFSSQMKAEKTAKYVLNQIEKGNFPPTLSKAILDSLEVL